MSERLNYKAIAKRAKAENEAVAFAMGDMWALMDEVIDEAKALRYRAKQIGKLSSGAVSIKGAELPLCIAGVISSRDPVEMAEELLIDMGTASTNFYHIVARARGVITRMKAAAQATKPPVNKENA